MKKVVSAGIIPFHNHSFLLLHYAAGHWDFPKGHVEKDEAIVCAARRELEEETGISRVEIIDGFDERIHYCFKQDKELVSKDVHFFLGEVNSAKVVLSDEHQGFEWLPFRQAIEKLTFDNAKDLLKKAQDFLEHEK